MPGMLSMLSMQHTHTHTNDQHWNLSLTVVLGARGHIIHASEDCQVNAPPARSVKRLQLLGCEQALPRGLQRRHANSREGLYYCSPGGVREE